MTTKTAQLIKRLLKTQKEHTERNPKDEKQKAYYYGLTEMIELIATECYSKETTVDEYLNQF